MNRTELSLVIGNVMNGKPVDPDALDMALRAFRIEERQLQVFAHKARECERRECGIAIVTPAGRSGSRRK